MRSQPLSSTDEPLVERIAEEILERQRKGEKPTVEEYCLRYPEHAEELRSFLPALMAVEGLKPNSKDVTGSLGGEIELEGKRREFIGDYRILRELGRGGMGVVYEAEQQSLGRHVALKVLLRSVAGDARAAKRFESEARAAARMHHTNIVPVFDVGSDDEHLYYAMQLIQGQALDLVVHDLKQLRNVRNSSSAAAQDKAKAQDKSIARSLAAGQFHQDQLLEQTQDSSLVASEVEPIRAPSPIASLAGRGVGDEGAFAVTETLDARTGSSHSAVMPGQRDMSSAENNRPAYFLSVAKIGQQTAEALAYAHARGIIHRDIKPANLLLDGSGILWITDFGLAKTGDHGMTHTGEILGTIRYMSPERFKGQCDARADIYSLGLTLYEMLTLQPAFSAADQLKLIDRIVKSEPPAPRTLDASVPRDLETIVLKCIDKDPRRRYQSADELSEDLDRFIHDEPVKARRISLAERMARWSRRNKAMAASLAVVASLLLTINIAGPLVTWRMARLKSAADDAKGLADQRAETIQHNLYVSNMNLGGFVSMTNGAIERIKELTDPWIPEAGQSDLRGWEWYYLRSGLYQAELGIHLPLQNIDVARFNRAGTHLATVSENSIQIWDATSGRQTKSFTLAAGDERIVTIDWHPDGMRLAVRLSNPDPIRSSIKLWHITSGKVETILECDGDPMNRERANQWSGSLAWNADGTQLASTYVGRTDIIDLQTEESVTLHSASRHIAWSPDGLRFAIYTKRGIEIWDWQSQQRLFTLDISPEMFSGIAWSPDGSRIAAYERQRLWISAVSEGAAPMKLGGHFSSIRALAWSSDGKQLASADDLTIRVWEPLDGRQLQMFKSGHSSDMLRLTWGRGDLQLASVSEDGMIKFWTIARDVDPPTLNARTIATWSPNRNLLALASESQGDGVKVWDADSLELLHTLKATSGSRSLAISPEGNYMAVGGQAGRIDVWDLVSGQLSDLRCPKQDNVIWCMGWSKLNLLATTDFTGAVQVLQIKNPGNLTGHQQQPIHRLTMPGNRTVLDWSKDGKILAIGDSHGNIRTWDYESREEVTWKGHSGRIMSISWSPDGHSLISCSNEERRLVVWDGAKRVEKLSLKGHSLASTDVDWSPDGKRIASAGRDGSVKIWHAESGQELLTLNGHEGFLTTVKWNHDGTCLVSSDANGVTYMWDARKGYADEPLEISGTGR